MRWYYGWNIVAVCLAFQAITWGIGSYCFTFWVVPWINEFGAARSEIMLASTAIIIVMGVLSPIVGPAMDRLSIRAFLCGGGAIFSFGLFLMSQASAIWQIILLNILFIAVGMTLVGPLTGQILAAKWFRANRGLAIGLVSAGTAIGGMLLPPIATALLQPFGWRGAMLILSLLPLLLVPVAWLVIRNTPLEKGVEPEPEPARASRGETALVEREWSSAEILRDRGFLVIALAFVPPNIAVYGILQNLGPYTNDIGFSAGVASAFMSTIGGLMLLGKIMFGRWSDMYDKRLLYWIAMLALALVLLAMIMKPGSFWVMLLVSAVFGFTSGSILPVMGATIATRFGTQAFGRVMGLLYPFICMSSVGPLLTGWMRDRFGTYDSAFWLLLAALAPAALIMATFPSAPGRKSVPA